MANALIGFSGFVGGTLLRQASFDALYRSSNIDQIDGHTFDTVICAGAPAQKWLANREPVADCMKIEGLIAHLDTIHCRTFILISTVDTFRNPVNVDEATPVDEAGLHAYGLHRRLLEKFVERRFPNHLTARLPGLVGPGLRKNVIFDLLNHNNVDAIDSRAVFQFYPMVNLWHDLQLAQAAGLKLVHLTAEPVSVAEVALQGFGMRLDHALDTAPARYDMRSLHARVFGATGHYPYSARETFQAIRSYAQSGRLLAMANSGAEA
ncbi:pyridine nucleotide transhydrogenase [Paraburkholderia sp. GAS334]|uniref:pyridine nucleotide transhydrogenase n=1 Tax=Paraburkholderia sp. GAS334 TaxID=3035131 RepID=UPI003D21C200